VTPPRDARPHVWRTDDGVVLHGWIWEPETPRGIVVVRTPYGAWRHGDTARSWVRRGYRCLVQDVRGRHDSGGEWNPYLHERRDGASVVVALRAQDPHLPVVLSGGSYDAHAALECARDVDVDALVLMVPALGLAETAWDAEGRPQLLDRIGWWHQHGRGPRSFPPLTEGELYARVASAERRGVERAARDWGWAPTVLAGWRRLWTTPPVDLDRAYGAIDAPLLLIRGDDDFFHADAGRLAAAWGADVHVVDGPWGHRLGADIRDEDVRARLRDSGGIGGVLDAWLARTGLPSGAAGTRHVVPAGRRSRSAFEPRSGRWHHERTA